MFILLAGSEAGKESDCDSVDDRCDGDDDDDDDDDCEYAP